MYNEDVQFENDAKITLNHHVDDDGSLTQDVILHTLNFLEQTTLFLGRQTKGGIKAFVPISF